MKDQNFEQKLTAPYICKWREYIFFSWDSLWNEHQQGTGTLPIYDSDETKDCY